MKRTLWWILVVAASPVSLSAPALAQALPTQAITADQQLKSLYDNYAVWDAREAGYFMDAKGEVQPTAYLGHSDRAALAARETYLKATLARLNAIPAAQLSKGEGVNAAVFRTILENAVDDYQFRAFEMPFNSDTNFWTYLDAANPLADAAAYRRYIARLNDVPRYFAEQVANARAGLKRGFSVPRSSLQGRDGSIAAFLDKSGEASPFFAAFKSMPSTITPADQAQLRADALAAIERSVLPAYRKLLAFYRDDYLPNARTTVGAHDLPDGDAFYRAQIRQFTTTNLGPEEIHQIGLKEVARIDRAMQQAMRDSGWKGDFPGFLKFLRTDPQFYARTPDELLGVSSYAAKRVDGKLRDLFGQLPRRRFAIIPVADALAPFYTAGRGGLESCQMNTYNLPTRPLYMIPVLTLHECAPGHALQAAISEEAKSLPAFRRNIYFSGYGEGWGLYSEWLGNEMGIYRTPYEKFGQLSYEMWRAARLVIDTGLHRYGWSRQQAIDYLAGHTSLSEHEVETEIDRYIGWPGQALSYKLGELTIRKLRSEAEARLGTRFDERGFHDTLLGMGAVPLGVLEVEMRAWIAAEAAKPPLAPVKG